MKYWLIIWFFAPGPDGSHVYVDKREIAYKDEASCYVAMDYIKPPQKAYTIQMHCVSDDHFRGRKVDQGVPLD